MIPHVTHTLFVEAQHVFLNHTAPNQFYFAPIKIYDMSKCITEGFLSYGDGHKPSKQCLMVWDPYFSLGSNGKNQQNT